MSDVIKPDFRSLNLTIRDKKHTGCQHKKVTVDDRLRTVECTTCGVILDPIEVILEYAHGERSFFTNDRHVKSLHKQLKESIGELIVEEKRIKSRVRYAKTKAANNCEVADVCKLAKKLNEDNYALRRQLSISKRSK